MELSHANQKLMKRGMTALTRGRVSRAAARFDEVISATGDETPAEPYQQRAICFRILADRADRADLYAAADQTFQLAYDRAETDLHRAQILRDWAMVHLGQNDYDEARLKLTQSAGMLHSTEYFTTIGFLARVYWKQGEIEKARALFRHVDSGLRGTPIYLLNNRIWNLKLEPIDQRIALAPRTFWIALRMGNFKRMIQILLLVLHRPSPSSK